MVIQDVPQTVKFFIGGDFNGHISEDSEGHDIAHGGFGYGERNNGVFVLDFAIAYELLEVNFYFRKKQEHLVTLRVAL